MVKKVAVLVMIDVMGMAGRNMGVGVLCMKVVRWAFVVSVQGRACVVLSRFLQCGSGAGMGIYHTPKNHVVVSTPVCTCSERTSATS